MFTFLVMAATLAVPQKPMTPEAIIEKGFEGKTTVEFVVTEAGLFRTNSDPTGFLSEALWLKAGKGSERFTVIVSRETASRLRQLGIDDLVAHFRSKVVRVTGTVKRQVVGDRTDYHLAVNGLEQIEVVRKP